MTGKPCGFIFSLAFLSLVHLLTGCVTTQTDVFSGKGTDRQAAEAYWQLSSAYLQRGQLQHAEQHAQYALSLYSKHAKTHHLLATIAQKKQQTNLAERYFKSLLSLDPYTIEGRMDYAAFLESQQRYQLAIDQINHVMKQANYQPMSKDYQLLGRCYQGLGDTQNMTSFFMRAVALDSDNAFDMLAASRAAFSRQDFDLSWFYFDRHRDKAKTLNKDTAWLGIQLARLLNKQKEESTLITQLRAMFVNDDDYDLFMSIGETGDLAVDNK